MPTLTHDQAVYRGRLGGLASKGKKRVIDPAVAHSRAKIAGEANRRRWEVIRTSRMIGIQGAPQ